MKIAQQQSDELKKIGELLQELKVGMLTTVDADGELRSRPLQTLELDSLGRVWFFTSGSAPKVGEINAHGHHVNLSYADAAKQNYLSISGTGIITRDRARMEALWTPWAKVWFPQGLDDPDLALLCVEIDKAEYWEAPGSAVKRLYGLAKALATGDKSAIGDNEKIAVRREDEGSDSARAQAFSKRAARR
jgi:general stress protein 26